MKMESTALCFKDLLSESLNVLVPAIALQARGFVPVFSGETGISEGQIFRSSSFEAQLKHLCC